VPPVHYTPDGRTLVTAAPRGGGIKVWDVATGQERFTLSLGGTTLDELELSPGGKIIAASLTRGKPGSYRSEIKLWDRTTGKELATYLEKGWDVQCLAFSPDGRTLASGHGNALVEGGYIKLRDLTTFREKAVLWGHQLAVKSLVFSPDGRTLASAAEAVKLWDPTTGQELATLSGAGPVEFSRDGRVLVTHTSDQYEPVKLWFAAGRAEVDARSGAEKEVGLEALEKALEAEGGRVP
jgi:dipeptidyl aminopeptidase/acylaminoacyl peptidase